MAPGLVWRARRHSAAESPAPDPWAALTEDDGERGRIWHREAALDAQVSAFGGVLHSIGCFSGGLWCLVVVTLVAFVRRDDGGGSLGDDNGGGASWWWS